MHLTYLGNAHHYCDSQGEVSEEISIMSWGLTLVDKEMGSGEDDVRCRADKASTLCV